MSTVRHDTSTRHLKKYNNRNPLHRFTLNRFFAQVAREILRIEPARMMEFGCGEGLFLKAMQAQGVEIRQYVGIDIRADAIDHARQLHADALNCRFEVADLLTWDASPESYDLVIASQVLEHLHEPGLFLERMTRLSRGYLLLTVPWEPWFQLMNLLRGRDLTRLGNHPEHVNHWSLRAFRKFVSGQADIVRSHTVFPFLVAVASPFSRGKSTGANPGPTTATIAEDS